MNPNTYTTPRTAPAGKVNHSLAAEFWGYNVPSDYGEGRRLSGGMPAPPTYTLRVGLADRFELGARVANFSSVGADAKWNFLKSPAFDAAIDPSVQWFHLSYSVFDANGMRRDASSDVVYIHAPILLGLNVSEAFSVTFTPGVSYGFASAKVRTTDARDSASGTTGIMGRVGLGFDVRLSPKFAVHPEVTFLRTFDPDAKLVYVLGVGFNLGNLPSFADVGAKAAPQP